MFSCILLAAGLSERFGSPKALAKIGERTVIECLQGRLLESQVDEIIVVLGAKAAQIKPYLLNHKKVSIVHNKDYNFGQTSSFQAGLKTVSPSCQGVLLLPVDYPLISRAVIDLLIDHFKKRSPLILIPAYKGIKGHPPLFSIELKDEFLALGHDCGINSIAHEHDVVTLPVDDSGVTATFNTPRELEQIAQPGQ